MTTKKADYIWFNGDMVPWGEARVHVMSHALHYGTSVFEGVRCYDTHRGPAVFRHREHMHACMIRRGFTVCRWPTALTS